MLKNSLTLFKRELFVRPYVFLVYVFSATCVIILQPRVDTQCLSQLFDFPHCSVFFYIYVLFFLLTWSSEILMMSRAIKKLKTEKRATWILYYSAKLFLSATKLRSPITCVSLQILQLLSKLLLFFLCFAPFFFSRFFHANGDTLHIFFAQRDKLRVIHKTKCLRCYESRT